MIQVIDGKAKRVLFLTLTRKWFDEIATGRKTELIRRGYVGQSYFRSRGAALRFLEKHLAAGVADRERELRRAQMLLSAARNGLVFRREYSTRSMREVPTLPGFFAV